MTDKPFRVLPRVTTDNEHFWTGGSQGELRFLRCRACGYYIHPPGVLCPKCHSAQVVLQRGEPELKEPYFRAKFQWRCDACGYQWVDDGFTKEAAGGQSWPGEEFPSRDKDSS